MARRYTASRRSPVEWGVRASLAVAAAWLGYGAVIGAVAYNTRAVAPERAHALAPRDARIAAVLSQQLSGPEARPADRARADVVARAALRRDATAVDAVATLGLNAQIRGDVALARRLFVYSNRLSRRDLRTRLWAIEDAVARGDVAATLHNYDIALRTSRGATDLLYPVLASAIADPPIRIALVRTLAAGPAWTQPFISHAVGHTADARVVAMFFAELGSKNVAVPDWAQASVIARLIAEGHADAAWRHYATIRPKADRRMSRDPLFATTVAVPAPFDWVQVEDAGMNASIQRGEKGRVFGFSAPPNIGGVVLRQTQMLPAGDYVLAGRSTGVDQPAVSLPYWALTCINGLELGRVVVPPSEKANGRFAGALRVPANCPVQQLVLVLRPSEALAGVEGWIEQVQLRPAR